MIQYRITVKDDFLRKGVYISNIFQFLSDLRNAEAEKRF